MNKVNLRNHAAGEAPTLLSETEPASPIHQANLPARTVTSCPRRAWKKTAGRKWEQRGRDSRLYCVWEDCELFTDPATLSQKAGCQPKRLRAIVLHEIVDNALEAGAAGTLNKVDDDRIISDKGPGIDPVEIPKLFAVKPSTGEQ